ncbi:MAG: SOS response-associated peptidase family protein [Clostridia bacterium]|nr:SOS response-associated peptidase family protein [Clostridia bacterium]
MCGRYQAWVDDDELVRIIEREKKGNVMRYFQRNEVFPGTVLPVIYGSYANVRAHLSTWGYLLDGRTSAPDPAEPETVAVSAGESSAKKNSGILINARAETAASKPMFRGASTNNSPTERRILVLTSGYYEWESPVQNAQKIRWHIRPEKPGSALLLAGLETDLCEGVRRHVILTTEAVGSPASIHHRMPLLIRREEMRSWLYDTDFALAKMKEKRESPLVLQRAE